MTGGTVTLSVLQQCRIPLASELFLFQARRSSFHTTRLRNASFQSFSRMSYLTSGKIVCSGSETGSSTSQNIGIKEKSLETKVGAFQILPMVMPSVDILSSAQRKARNVTATKGIANIAKRERNKAAKQLDTLMKELAVPLRVYIEKFPKRQYLHPYESSLIELTLGDGNYEEVLKRVDELRKKLLTVGKKHASLCAQFCGICSTVRKLNKNEANAEHQRTSTLPGLKKLEEVFKLEKTAVDDLLYIAKTLRAMPVVNLEIPTLCLVGAPNVGKSSLVRILSTGKPEVCNYPFTTRGILMGHIVQNYERFQVTDTPGLLRRHDDNRNNLEKLTLAVLTHLPTAILYVHDLTGECGTSPADQFSIFKEIKGRFRNHIWLDVISKSDLLQEPSDRFSNYEYDDEDNDLKRYKVLGPDKAMRVSVKTEAGISEIVLLYGWHEAPVNCLVKNRVGVHNLSK
ncbi:Nucleolar GTP-binding protein 1 [Apostasia shenzhenica]|uniref:Nucleolar GTP-binding protein 1 n=1 Tax=Apostasia shenzhenica TaxID=1088818 RepID=A0A2I0BES1_9ASPA|nr:Nucleolar GTP-binding protein 1 [Apostasia shenzhenica]